MASPFIEKAHDGAQHQRDKDYLFYYGVKPHEVHLLRVGTEFSVVYTDRWKAVLFRVKQGDPGKPNVYEVVRERPLEPDEIEHFAALVAGL